MHYYTYHCLNGTCDAYKLIFSTANLIFAVVMKVAFISVYE